MKFTPVPWAVGRMGETVNKADFLRFLQECWEKSGEAVNQFRPLVVVEDETGHIVAILGPGPKTEENSSLIAAAPDLHEALQELCDKCEPLTGDLSYEASPMSYVPCLVDVLLCVKRAVEDAEATLAKARGEA